MTDADWWATVKPPVRPREYKPRPSRRVWTLHKGQRDVALDLRPVHSIGTELVLSVDGELRRSRVNHLTN